ncbi:hypothetical protein TNCV_2426401 [Trichonephila clavipes]|nr:hypothetical protein TNCV_2426401 [Trichonephila clavipes]
MEVDDFRASGVSCVCYNMVAEVLCRPTRSGQWIHRSTCTDASLRTLVTLKYCSCRHCYSWRNSIASKWMSRFRAHVDDFENVLTCPSQVN